jgi:hypothetical protein
MTARDGSAYGSGANRTASTTANIATLAPIARASMTTAASECTRRRAIIRTP